MSSAHRLRRSEDGAVMVLGVVMAVFLVAMLYYVVGIGQAIYARETLQDAADAGAFAAAAVHARGMNILVLINMIMAALMAVLVGLRLVQTVLIGAIALCIGLAYWTGGTSMKPVPGLNKGQNTVGKMYEKAHQPIGQALGALNCGSVGIRHAMPLASHARVLDMVALEHGSAAVAGFVWPLYSALPTEDDEPSVLCEKASGYVADIATWPMEQLIGDAGKWLMAPVGAMITGLTKVGAGWFCGKPGASMPKIDSNDLKGEGGRKPERLIPKAPDQAECESTKNEDACNRAVEYFEKAVPNRETGECDGRAECEDYVKRSRVECKDARDIVSYRYQMRGYHVVFRRAETVSKTKNPRLEGYEDLLRSEPAPNDANTRCDEVFGRYGDGRPRFQESSRRPCGSSFQAETRWTDWNPKPGEPLCIPDPLPTAPRRHVNKGEEVVVCFNAVSESLGCAQRYEQKFDPPEKNEGFENDKNSGCNNRVTQRIVKDAILGEGTFQLRAFILGENRENVGEAGVSIATHGRELSSETSRSVFERKADSALAGIQGVLRPLRRVQVAQAEYYFDQGGAEGDRDAWMWRMRWRARMRRFYFDLGTTGAGTEGDMESACAGKSKLSGSCGSAIPGIKKLLQDALFGALVH